MTFEIPPYVYTDQQPSSTVVPAIESDNLTANREYDSHTAADPGRPRPRLVDEGAASTEPSEQPKAKEAEEPIKGDEEGNTPTTTASVAGQAKENADSQTGQEEGNTEGRQPLARDIQPEAGLAVLDRQEMVATLNEVTTRVGSTAVDHTANRLTPATAARGDGTIGGIESSDRVPDPDEVGAPATIAVTPSDRSHPTAPIQPQAEPATARQTVIHPAGEMTSPAQPTDVGILETTRRLSTKNHISQEAAMAAIALEAEGTVEHTTGYELEVLRSAAPDTPKIGRVDSVRASSGAFWGDVNHRARYALGRYKFNVGDDGMYEICTLPAMHPQALVIATHGLIRTGWLPKQTVNGEVTAHVSIGSTTEASLLKDNLEQLINILRVVELTGGTSADRLMRPIIEARSENFMALLTGWNCKGFLGVNVVPRTLIDHNTEWSGDNNRIEFRTLAYSNPTQFSDVLSRLYFLTRGLITTEHTAAVDIFDTFYTWLQGYCNNHCLPFCDAELLDGPIFLDHYMQPYAQHMEEGPLVELESQVSATIEALQEEFSMSGARLRDPQHIALDK